MRARQVEVAIRQALGHYLGARAMEKLWELVKIDAYADLPPEPSEEQLLLDTLRLRGHRLFECCQTADAIYTVRMFSATEGFHSGNGLTLVDAIRAAAISITNDRLVTP